MKEMVKEYTHGGLVLAMKGRDIIGIFPEGCVPEGTSEGRRPGVSPVQVHVTGQNRPMGHGVRNIGCCPGDRMQLVSVTQEDGVPVGEGKVVGTLVTCVLEDDASAIDATGLMVKAYYHFVDGLPVVRAWLEVENRGERAVGLEWVYSLILHNLASGGIQGWWEKTRIHVGHNSWFGEGQWQTYHPRQLGLTRCNPSYSEASAAQVSCLGSMSSSKALPMGILEDVEEGISWFWQIEHSGTWSWEIGESAAKQLYLLVGGPTEPNGGWWLSLEPGESFHTVPVAAGAVVGGFEEAITALTRYRRVCLVPDHPLDKELPVIFNDYMNCLMANPTTEKEMPLVEAAARAGAEYFVIDAGWYAPLDRVWWDTVGGWEPDEARFPGGFEVLTAAIRHAGLVPGLWLEIEVVGINSPLAAKPDSWFMMRHGKRVADNGRYFLDFRNPEVRVHCLEVIERLVTRYGVGYFKNDYNVNATLGTDVGAHSGAHGLLEHIRAFYGWLDEVGRRFPDVVMESCASGGNRMDYGLLSRVSIQSSSDQMDYRIYPSVLAGASAGVVPEQLAVWSYPMAGGDSEETIFNMVNAMLLRVHLSGHLAGLEPERFAHVRDGISVYKSIRTDIARGLPFWPMGLVPCDVSDAWISFGLRVDGEDRAYLAVWRLASGMDSCTVPLESFKGRQACVELLYPKTVVTDFSWSDASGILSIKLPNPYSARVFRISL